MGKEYQRKRLLVRGRKSISAETFASDLDKAYCRNFGKRIRSAWQ